jgi:hypothetical protein
MSRRIEVGGKAEFGVVGHADRFASVLKRNSGAPDRTSPRARPSCSASRSVRIVGSKNVPPSAWRLPPVDHFGALGDGVRDVFLDLFDAPWRRSAAPASVSPQAVADLQLATDFFEFFAKAS